MKQVEWRFVKLKLKTSDVESYWWCSCILNAPCTNCQKERSPPIPAWELGIRVKEYNGSAIDGYLQ